MTVATVFASHSPLKDYLSPGSAIEDEVNTCLAEVRNWIAEFAPDLIIAVGPDHFNGFFYRLMPSFCIGAAAESVGDWNTPGGSLPVAGDVAEDCVRALHAAGIDAAISYSMDVDHGVTQLLDQLFDWKVLPPIVPVFINCAAPPRPPIARVIAFGKALGEFVTNYPGRVLLAASGGISDDPPMPQLASAPEPIRKRIIAGGRLDPEARAARQERVLAEATRQIDGTSDRTPLNAEWDHAFLARLQAFDFDALASMIDESITRDGGCGGHEIRTWIAVAAAAASAGIAHLELRYYRPIPEWIAGYGVMTGNWAACTRPSPE